MFGIFCHQFIPCGITYNAILRQFILSLEMFYCCERYLAKVIRRLIVIHKAQIHQSLLKLLYDLMAHAFSQILRRRFCIFWKFYIIQSRQYLSVQS